jgi:hypothetical protein
VSLDVGAKESVGELRKEALSGQILVDSASVGGSAEQAAEKFGERTLSV